MEKVVDVVGGGSVINGATSLVIMAINIFCIKRLLRLYLQSSPWSLKFNSHISKNREYLCKNLRTYCLTLFEPPQHFLSLVEEGILNVSFIRLSSVLKKGYFLEFFRNSKWKINHGSMEKIPVLKPHERLQMLHLYHLIHLYQAIW